MAEANAPVMRGGSFYGAVQRRHEQCDAIFTDLQHSSARKLPEHAHELPFFAVLLQGDYGERYGRQQKQFGPFSMAYRPAGVPHQDEIGPRGVRFFEIEIRPSWRRRIQDCSGDLDTARDESCGGEMLWLAMKLFRETREGDSDLHLESTLAELVGCVARCRAKPPRMPRHYCAWRSSPPHFSHYPTKGSGRQTRLGQHIQPVRSL